MHYTSQQQKAKMPAAGATQALRLFCDPLGKISWHIKKEDHREEKKKNEIS